MDQAAILHIPLSQYAFANKEKELTIRIRTKKMDVTACTLFYGDRACNHTPVEFYPLPMECMASDDLFDYYEITFDSPFTRVCYYFKLEDEVDWTYYYSGQFTKEMADLILNDTIIEGRSEYYQYPFILREEIIDVPTWFKNAVVYNIFPDSFASGEHTLSCEEKEITMEDGTISRSRLGGTMNGIRENLSYIKNLGFTCIYLNPIFVAGESHKYDILDYYHIDPCFGTDEDFKHLVEAIHEMGMHIIIDGVFNHCSWMFFAFEDVIINGEKSNYVDWFYELSFPVKRPEHVNELPSYACFAYEPKMPKLNTSNVEVQNYFAEVARYWIREFKIDGWRLDVANEIDRNFWRVFRSAAKEENPNTVLIGEVWENSETWLRGDAFDSTMNYDFRKHCRDFFALGKINAKTFAGKINQMLLRYPTNICDGQLNLLDSHDVPRFLSLCQNDLKKWKQAFIFLMFAPGVPSLFYGDETGIYGVTEKEYRSPMRWEEMDSQLLEFVTNVIGIRKKYITYESKFQNHQVDENNTVFSFTRMGEIGKIEIYLNVGQVEYQIPINKSHTLLLQSGIQNNILNPWGYGIYLVD